MALNIELPPRLAKTRIVAGIVFTDGHATVRKIGTSTRRYLEHVGATITSDGEAGPLAKRTLAELRAAAADLDLDLPESAKKTDLIEAISSASEG
ncbi:hypothetical protein [Microbacterium sp. gxy059]|uniref:hypothetical protein n=1 Tax=Microbacterium sp. gxy059 TaxID=2957199 RepID=UPI003D991E21